MSIERNEQHGLDWSREAPVTIDGLVRNVFAMGTYAVRKVRPDGSVRTLVLPSGFAMEWRDAPRDDALNAKLAAHLDSQQDDVAMWEGDL